MIFANTANISIRRSYANSAPTTLKDGELGYSFVSDKLFIGNTANSIITIGGKYYTNIIDSANSQNIPSTLVKRDNQGRVDLGRITTNFYPETNIDVVAKGYVDNVLASSRGSIFFGTPGNTGYSEALATSEGINITANNRQVARFRESQIFFDEDVTISAGNIFLQDVVSTGNLQAQNIIAFKEFFAGVATSLATPLPNLIAQFTGNTNSYVQVNVQNIDGEGSADYVVTADIGTDTTFFTDVGIQGSQLSQGALKPLDGYLLVQGNTGQPGGNLVIGTISATPGLQTKFLVGGIEDENIIMKLDSTGANVYGTLFAQTLIGPTIDNIYTQVNNLSGYIDVANNYNQTYTNSANTWLQANDRTTLIAAKVYTDSSNTWLQANDSLTLSVSKSYTDSTNTWLQGNDRTTLIASKVYTDSSNTWLQANDRTTLIAAKVYTDSANTWLQANDSFTLSVAEDYTDTIRIAIENEITANLTIALNYTNTANTFLQANDAITLGIAKNYTDIAYNYLNGNDYTTLLSSKSYTDSANTWLQANDFTTFTNSKYYTDITRIAIENEIDANLVIAKAYTDVSNTYNQSYTDEANTYNSTYTLIANTWLQGNDRTTLIASKVYTDTANTYLQANDYLTWTTSKSYTDVANTYVQGLNTTTNNYVLAVETYAKSAYAMANSANVFAQEVYDSSNTKFSSSGGFITGFANVSSNVSVGTYVDFNTTLNNPTNLEGRLFYDKEQHALSYYNEGNVTLQIGQEHVVRVWNNSGTQINNGSVVYITQGSSANGFSNVALALASSQITSEAIGIATENIPNGSYGYITGLGKVNGLNTSLFTEGLELFLSDTIPGGLTNTPPAPPAVPINIGYTTISDVTNGQIYVSIHLMEGVNKTSGSILFVRNKAIDEDPTHLFWDYQNNSLGIGTGTPAANLHVVGSGLFTGNVIISGNLLVSNAQSITTTQLTVGGNTVILNSDVTGIPVTDATIIVNRGSSVNAEIRWSESEDDWFIYRGAGTPGHILDSEETFTSWTDYSLATTYEKSTTPIGANLSNTINELAKVANTVAYIAEAQALVATSLAQSAYNSSNNVNTYAGSAYAQANTANTRAYSTALKSGDTFSGDVTVPNLIANTSITIDAISRTTVGTYTTSSLSQVTLDTFSSSTYRSAKYQIQITSGSDYHTTEMQVLHNGTTVWIAEYGEIITNAHLGVFDATISTGTLSLLFTPVNSSTTIKFIRNTINI